MSFQNDKDAERKRKSGPQGKSDSPQQTQKKAKKDSGDRPELGNALRSVYQRTIDEDIPPEMLDLLGKLG